MQRLFEMNMDELFDEKIRLKMLLEFNIDIIEKSQIIRRIEEIHKEIMKR